MRMLTAALLKQRSWTQEILKRFWISPCRWVTSEASWGKRYETRPSADNTATLYVHWPYCARRCTYCNFNKYVSKSVDHTRMTDCLVKETTTLLQLSGVTRVPSIFFGGGTPSLARPSTAGRIVDTVRDHVTFTEGSEVTLEANPTHLETNKLRDFKHAGVNRLSIGVQALNSDDLKLLGRDHSVQEALRCVEEAMKIFSGRVSVDLIFGRPGHTLEAWIEELNQVIGMGVNHVSLYQLTLERGTQLFKWVESGQVTVPTNDTMADLYTEAVQLMHAHGLERYEVSNFARKGSECKHNQSYWKGSQYLGVGPGAHGRLTPLSNPGCDQVAHREARIQTLEPDNWMYEVEKFGHATRKIVQQSTKDSNAFLRQLQQTTFENIVAKLEEILISGLRTRDGVNSETLSEIAGTSIFSTLLSSERCQQFVRDGLLCVEGSVLCATSDGMLILDSVLPHLLHTLIQVCEKEGIT